MNYGFNYNKKHSKNKIKLYLKYQSNSKEKYILKEYNLIKKSNKNFDNIKYDLLNKTEKNIKKIKTIFSTLNKINTDSAIINNNYGSNNSIKDCKLAKSERKNENKNNYFKLSLQNVIKKKYMNIINIRKISKNIKDLSLVSNNN